MELEEIFVSEKALKSDEINDFLSNIDKETLNIHVCEDKLFEKISDTVASQGIVGVVKLPDNSHSEIKENGLYIALDRLQDPGNLGTIIRTADAAGVDGILVSKGTVDPFNAKVLRSTMGSIFKVNLIFEDDLKERLVSEQKNGAKVLVTNLENAANYNEINYMGTLIIVIGNEGSGVSSDIINMATQNVKIPIWGEAESLNASVAAGILMYEAAKTRRGL